MSILDELRDRHRDKTQDGTQGGQRQDTRQCVCCLCCALCACVVLYSALFHAAYVTVVGKEEQLQNLIPKCVSSKNGMCLAFRLTSVSRHIQLRGLNCLNTKRRHVLIARYSQTIKPPPICGFSTHQSVHRNFSFVAGYRCRNFSRDCQRVRVVEAHNQRTDMRVLFLCLSSWEYD